MKGDSGDNANGGKGVGIAGGADVGAVIGRGIVTIGDSSSGTGSASIDDSSSDTGKWVSGG